TKTTALFAVAINRDRTSRERLLHERRDHHAILAGLSRSHSIEQADDYSRQFLFPPECEREKLIDRFRAGVTPASLRGRAHDEIAVFRKRDIRAQAVHFRR